MKRFKTAMIPVFLLAVLLGSNTVIARAAMQSVSPYALNAARVSLTALIYLISFALIPGWRWPRDLSVWLQAGLWGIFGFALPLTAFMHVLTYFSSGVTSLFGTLSPVVVAILAHFLLQDERLTLLKIAGSLIAFGGVAIILFSGETGLGGLVQADPRGYLWAAVGVLSGSGSVVYSRRFLSNMESIQATGIRTVVAAPILIAVAIFTGNFQFQPLLHGGNLLGLIYLASIGTFVIFILEFHVIQSFGAGPASQMNYLLPPIATGLGVLFLGEQISLVFVTGMLVIFIGLFLVNYTPRPQPTPDPQTR